MVREYREGRVKFTEAIENAVIDLVLKDKDTGKKNIHKGKWYKAEVGKALHLSDNDNPSLRSYEWHLDKIRENLRVKNPLDAIWTIGSCEKYDIPSDIVPHLIEMRKIYSAHDIDTDKTMPKIDYRKADPSVFTPIENCPTIRQARWIARLFPLVDKLIDARKGPKFPYPARYCFHGVIASHYARREQISEAQGKLYPDTADLDNLYFINQDLDILEGQLRTFCPGSDLLGFYLKQKKDGGK